MQIDSLNLFNRKIKNFVRFFLLEKLKRKARLLFADLVQFCCSNDLECYPHFFEFRIKKNVFH